IRVHMAHLGAPVAGDFLYGQEDASLGRQALHSASIAFAHPITKQAIALRCPLPQDLVDFLKSKKILWNEEDLNETFDI
ncbi:MAG: RluA family pseudouridine synthase, partial [Clostridia bacterium]|nr:RluA family pseudouridine synthase [Clostridia bacterium]